MLPVKPVPHREPDYKRPPVLELPDRNRYIRAANQARRIFPGPVGELLHRELMSVEELGWAIGPDSLIRRLAEHILTLTEVPQ